MAEKRLNIRMDAFMERRIQWLMKRLKASQSDVVRLAIEETAARHRMPPSELEGPPDED